MSKSMVACLRLSVERHLARFGEQHLAGGVAPLEGGVDGPRLLAARQVVDFRQHDAPELGAARLVAPEVEPVHVAMGEPQAAMMRMVARFAGYIFHRVAARHDLAAGRTQRVQIGLVGFRSDEELGERLALDLDRDVLDAVLRDAHLGGQGRGQQDCPQDWLHGNSTTHSERGRMPAYRQSTSVFS